MYNYYTVYATGYYLVTEATGFEEGDIARVYSPKVNTTTVHCLVVNYLLYGRDIDTLTVYKYHGRNMVKTLGKIHMDRSLVQKGKQ